MPADDDSVGLPAFLEVDNQLFDFVKLTKDVLSDDPLFVLISSYTTGLQASVLSNILSLLKRKVLFVIVFQQVCLKLLEK